MLDFKKPYGHVYGHPWASYEQGGVLYDAAGDIQNAQEFKDLNAAAFDDPEEFLQVCLEGGPKLRDTVYKEAQIAKLDWASVESSAAKMGVKKYKSGIRDMWQLT